MLSAFNAEFDTWVPPSADVGRRIAEMLTGDHAYAVVAEDEGQGGFALVTLRPSPYYEGPVAAVDEMYVSPGLRGRGLGSELMTLVLRRALDLGCGEVQINVDEDDVGARRFYERHGFANHEPDDTERMLCYIQELRP